MSHCFSGDYWNASMCWLLRNSKDHWTYISGGSLIYEILMETLAPNQARKGRKKINNWAAQKQKQKFL
jgi:hypothetical protein